MSGDREVVVLPSADELAGEVAARVPSTLGSALQQRVRATVALTAGSIMEAVWGRLVESPDARALDWPLVNVFWGDERFVPADSPDRNDSGAERILFAHEPFSAAPRYSMPTSDAAADDLDAAATDYAATLRAARRPEDEGELPSFDIVLLGVGPDGHCCSLFPDHPSSRDLSATVIPVRNSPKPPPLRLSLSFDGLNSAREIWVVASGSGKADAVAAALAPDVDRTHVPSGGARGRERTVWFLDRDAAAKLPADA